MLVAVLLGCFGLGALPLIRWLTYALTRKDLTKVGSGNASVSAAFYHGGQWVGILAVCSEAMKGIAAVLLARQFLTDPAWEIVALIALVAGRFWLGGGAGTTNVVWGFIVHDWRIAALTALIGGIGFTILRERQLGKYGVLALLPLLTILLHPYQGERIVAVMVLSGLMALVYRRIPDDLDLSASAAQKESKQVFQFFRGDRALLSLDQRLSAEKVGQKAATLAQLRQWGYPVPMGWVLPPGDDPAPLFASLHTDGDHPLVVRSSAIGEDTESASAAGQYESFLNITSQPALEQAVLRCQSSYNAARAVQYRQRQQIAESGMAVLVQPQVQGAFSGVAFSRDPIQRQGNAVLIEALPGGASAVVSGRVTPEQYRVWLADDAVQAEDWRSPTDSSFPMEGEGEVPPGLIQQVAYLARHLEQRFHGVPQDVEWSYDGQQIWILQSRPITTLLPIWTRKIAAEVIPGFIPPLTWSINRPLTCGVWGELFTVVLGDRAQGLDFTETATLHHSAAYFNASLLGELFRRMGLPPESLEFLTRGAKFSKPPLRSTLRNVPGLLRLAGQEWQLITTFRAEDQRLFQPHLAELQAQTLATLTPEEIQQRIDLILSLLKRATYYNILAPLSFALRRSLFKVDEAMLDNTYTPEVASVRALRQLAAYMQQAGKEAIAPGVEQFLQQYGYLSDVTTDISVPRWRENPDYVWNLIEQFASSPAAPTANGSNGKTPPKTVQQRLNLKGRVAEVYNQLLAELRWSFVALGHQWSQTNKLAQPEDLFFVSNEEIQRLIGQTDSELATQLPDLIAARKEQWERDRQVSQVPRLVYGNTPPALRQILPKHTKPTQQLRGLGASIGIAEGTVVILKRLDDTPTITKGSILVVPYTDAGWAPALAQAGGIISEVGGRLSHGAIVAREYGIPAVMDIAHATEWLQPGQRVRIDGETGIVEVLDRAEG
ncbi:glycerol-3-phosphate acyltransferase [Leptolyngbya sp. AN02str]|uniref:glycerol-3-phosphate acyltransferase n=1 Tax=Leptolyngbya sp. AN02str TaxID=3423363 RepID=UPI003D319376